MYTALKEDLFRKMFNFFQSENTANVVLGVTDRHRDLIDEIFRNISFSKAVCLVKMAASSNVVLSPEIWKNWEKQGKTEFLKILKNLLAESNGTQSELKPARCIYELLSLGVSGTLKKEWVIATIGEILSLHLDIPSIVLDVLNILDSETLCSNVTDERNNFCTIVRESEKVIPEKLLKERLEIDTLQDVGTLKNKNFYTKFIRIKTKLYYKQKKFNLLREESEGYAKLITQLNQEVTANFTAENLLQDTKSLIGCFNLDPNRVLDIILEAFELRTELAETFMELLKSYTNEPKVLCEILGFKFSHYYENKERTPMNLYTVTALLLQYKVIQLEDIYPWLMPLDSVIEKEWEKEMKEAKEYARRLNIISTKEREGDDSEPEKESLQEKYAMTQKFGLCEALLNIGAWSVCQELCRNLPEHCVMEQPPVAKAMCNLLHSLIEPLYSANCCISGKVKRNPPPPITGKFTPKPVSEFLNLRTDVIPMLIALGPSLHFDPVLMYKIIRLCGLSLSQMGKEGVKQPPEHDSLYHDIIVLLDLVILPSLSYMDCNCSVAEEVWNVIKNYPYQIRYCLYSRWKNETPNEYAKLLRKNGEALKNIKNIMKRVSKENIKPVGRLIGKLTHASPGVLFDYVLIQIQMYENLIGPVVDSLKFLTNLSYDVLGYCLVETLANTSVDKDRFKYDGTSISMWLQSLSSFCGSAFKKYNIELTGLLQYVANQLKAEKSLDLLIMREVVQKMAGIEAAEEMTLDQLNAMSGGELLKGEAGYFSQVRNTKKSSLRLKEALSEQDLGVSLCLLMAQQRYCVIYRETDKSHLKLVGKLYDQCQDTLVQFGTFLCSTLSVDEYDARFPSIHAMLSEYHISADVAFFLARPTLNHAINMKYDALRKSDPNYKKLSLPAKQQKYCEAVQEVMTPLIESVKPLHSIKVWEDLSPQFLLTFWSLTMYDLQVPVESYQKEINKIKQSSLQVLDSKEMTTSKGKKEQERFNALMEKLQDEKKKQQEHVEKVMARLKLEKDSWFPTKSVRSPKNESIMQFLQLCIFPRCIFTAIDALYCSKFIHTIHTLKTANFSTLLCFDKLLCDLTYTVTLCTENEANRYGRFLCSVLELVMRWHGDVNIFKAECANHPGFVTKFRVSNQFSDANDEVSYENYRHVCHKWHYKITKAMVVCLESKDYVQIRNALIVLIKILPHFPVLVKLAQIIEKTIEKVQQEEKNQRQDLYILAMSYGGHLKAKGPMMVRESEFHQDTSRSSAKQGKEKKENSNEAGEKAEKREKSNSKSENKENGKSRTSRKETAETKRETTPVYHNTANNKEKIEKEEMKEETRLQKEEKPRSKDRKDDKHSKEDRSYREERYIETIPLSKDEQRYTPGYYSGTGHYMDETRDLSSLSNSSSGSHKHGGDTVEADRDVKRRKMDGSSSSKGRKAVQWAEPSEKSEKKERSSRTKEKASRDKDKEKDRKERKVGRKRERLGDDGMPVEGPKLRKDDEKGSLKSSSHQNGGSDTVELSHREKRHYSRQQLSPGYQDRDAERSRDRVMRSSHSTDRDRARSLEVSEREREPRDNHRRSEASKRR